MNVQQYRHQFHSDDAVGWQAIDAHLTQAYGAQVPRHYAPGPAQRRRMGGDNPLDGCSIYDHAPDGTLHRHVVSYGMSALYYDEDSAGGEHSGWGYLARAPRPRNWIPHWLADGNGHGTELAMVRKENKA